MVQTRKVSGVVQIGGTPAKRIVRAFGYNPTVHDLDGETLNMSKSLGHTTSDPNTGDYTIDLLAGYGNEIFVVAFDDYGKGFTGDMGVAVGERVHPTTPNGYVWECTSAGILPSDEPSWIVDTESDQLYGTASMIARPFYRPVVQGPILPVIDAVPDPEPHPGLLHFYTMNNTSGGFLIDEMGNGDLRLTGCRQVPGLFGSALYFDGIEDRLNLTPAPFNTNNFCYMGWAYIPPVSGDFFLLAHRSESQRLIQLSIQNQAITLQIRSSTSSIVQRNSLAVPAEPFFFALNFDNAGNCDLYINGVVEYSIPVPGGNYQSLVSVVGPYTIRSSTANDETYWDYIYTNAIPGRLERLRIFDQTLTASEIESFYNSGV